MSTKRKLYKSGYLHVCQKTADNGIIFLSVEDFLVFFTIMSVKAVAFDVIVMAVVIMFNHFHAGGFFKSTKHLSGFMNSTTSVFARIYNNQYGLEGQVFRKPFKSVPKYNEKKIRENLFYIWNNPVEKKAVEYAEEYRWNFMQYLDNNNPFSEPLDLSKASANLLKLIGIVTMKRSAGVYLDYSFFSDMYKSLPKEERAQLVDYIITSYSVIDKDRVMSGFGDYQSIVMASRTVAGSEFDMDDDIDEEDYRHYRQMITIARKEGVDVSNVRFGKGYFDDNQELYLRLRRLFQSEIGASDYEIAKFLHLL